MSRVKIEDKRVALAEAGWRRQDLPMSGERWNPPVGLRNQFDRSRLGGVTIDVAWRRHLRYMGDK